MSLRFNFEIGQLVQSLPELLHHQKKVVSILANQITSVAVQDLGSYFRLVAVLARYANFRSFHLKRN